jgi:predicted nucleotide-binding protein
MKSNLDKTILSESQKLWLKETYLKQKKGAPANKRTLKIELLDKLPKDFNPSDIDRRLLRGDVNITLFGIGLIDPESELIKKTDKVLQAIREILLKTPDVKRIDVYAISNLTGITNNEVAEIFERLAAIGLFHLSGTNYGPPGGWGSINIEEPAFDNYLKYESIAQWVESIVDEGNDKRIRQPQQVARMPRISYNETELRKVFIVHGHDDGLKNEVALFLTRLSLIPIILHEQTGKGRTLIEKLEAHASVPYAVVLLTPDDLGGKELNSLNPRARQNVVLELGYFYGRLTREYVCCLNKGVEIPSDSLGIEYVPYDSAGAWKIKLARELSEAFEIDMNRVQ